jgi:Fe2+ transport system protein FeoA
MNNVISSRMNAKGYEKGKYNDIVTNLAQADINEQYMIREVKTDDAELRDFLFTLGCYENEEITVISVLGENYVITIKDARYSIDKELAEAIII